MARCAARWWRDARRDARRAMTSGGRVRSWRPPDERGPRLSTRRAPGRDEPARPPVRDAWPCPARAAGQATNRTCRAHAAGRKRLVGHRTSASARGCCRGGIKPALGTDLGLPGPARRCGRTWFAARRATRLGPAVARARPAARRATRPGSNVVCCPPGKATRAGRRPVLQLRGLRVQRDGGPRPVAPSAAWTSTSSAPPPR